MLIPHVDCEYLVTLACWLAESLRAYSAGPELNYKWVRVILWLLAQRTPWQDS